MQKLHIIKCTGFSTAYDICTVLDCHKDIVYTVATNWIPYKFGSGYIEYEIQYSYVVDGE